MSHKNENLPTIQHPCRKLIQYISNLSLTVAKKNETKILYIITEYTEPVEHLA